MVNQLECQHTYGYITKSKRIELKLNKSHHNDAFVIANGTNQQRVTPFTVTQRRRNNRSLEKLPENLRVYRQVKLKKGKRAIRKQRYFFQPGDLVRLDNIVLTVKGTMSKGKSVLLSNKKTKTPKKLEL
ncbi:MAG: hypothetical protein U9P10_03355 [Thermodesulfobacteriota bacterium]|nr:hypothetical protein [Thermodesulfobacteriota bacterium]